MKITSPLLVGVPLLLLLLLAILWNWTPWQTDPASPQGAGTVETSRGTASELSSGSQVQDQPKTTGSDVPPRRTELPVAVHTLIRGAFLAPTGSWPGGGEVALAPGADKAAGNPLSMFAMGMDQARKARQRQLAGAPRQNSPPSAVARMLGLAPAVATAAIGPRGVFVIHNPPTGRFELRLRHPRLRAETVHLEVHRGEILDLGILNTKTAAGLLVLVTDARGRPVADANLELHRPLDRSKFLEPSARGNMLALIRQIMPRSARSDARGAHAFDGIDPNELWNLEVYHPGFAKEFRVAHLVAGQQTVLQVELGRGPSLSVSVVLPDGTPCRRARVELTFANFHYPTGYQKPGTGGTPDAMRKRAKLPPSGQQVLHGLYPGEVVVEVGIAGYLHEKKTVHLPQTSESPTQLEFVLREGPAISGQVVDEDGKPIPGARVMPMGKMAKGPLGIDFSSLITDMLTLEVARHGVPVDAEGRFRVGGLQAGASTRLLAVAAGHDPGEATAVAAGSESIEIRLQRLAELRGRVVADKSGSAIEEFRVVLQEKAFLVIDKNVASEDFRDRTDGSFVLGGAPRGTYKISITAPGFTPWSGRVDLSRGHVDLGELRLPPPSAIAGLVLDPGGQPVEKASVSLLRGGLMDKFAQASGFGMDGVETDAEGQFRLTPVAGTRVRLLVVKAGLAPQRTKPIALRRGETTEDVIIRLTAGGSLHGSIVDSADQPMVGWRVQALHNRGEGIHITKTDQRGEFLIEGMASGAHKLECMSMTKMSRLGEMGGVRTGRSKLADLQSFDIGKMISTAIKNTVTDRAVIVDGERSEIQLVWHGDEEDDAEAEGLVRVHGRVRLGDADLDRGMVFFASAGSTETGQLAQIEHGEFTLARILPGSYRCRVQADVLSGTMGRPKIVEIPAGAEVFELQIQLPGGTLGGRVVGVDGATPQPGVILSLSSRGASAPTLDRDEFGEGSLVSGKDGSFAFRGLAPGTYAIFAKPVIGRPGSPRTSASLTGLQLVAGEPRRDLLLRLSEGGSLRVRVMDSAGTRANALVTLLDASGQPTALFPRSLTDNTGTVTWLSLPAGSYRVSADAPKSASRVSERFEVTTGVQQDLDMNLAPGIPVEVRISEDLTRPSVGEQLLYTIWRQDGVRLRSGRLTVPDLDQPWRIGRYAPGRYRVRVESRRFGVVDRVQSVPRTGVGQWTLER